MSIQSELAAYNDGQQTEPQAYHHPSAPPHELFDISTTVDPSYIISLIRKLLPPSTSSSGTISAHGIDACDSSIRRSKAQDMEEGASSQSGNDVLNTRDDEYEAMDTVTDGEINGQDVRDERPGHRVKYEASLVGEEAWEEYGCVLWDLAASKPHAELMVQNLVLEVLLANLMVSQSARSTEIILGIIGNLACHEVLLKHIASTKRLVEIIVDQLFLDDTPCLSEACRLLTMCIQGSEGITWAEALQTEHALSRILWIAENTLNPQLIEKTVGFLLAILEGQSEVRSLLLPDLIKLGLPRLLISLLAFEMSKLMGERIPERYSVADLILRTTEALSVIDGYSQEICSNKELFQLLVDLVKIPDKIEVANCCLTAAVLIANMLTDAAGLALEISQDLFFLQGLLELLPFVSDDAEARSALWSIISRLLWQVQGTEMSPSSLNQYVSVLVSNSDLIEEELIDHELDDSNVNHELSPGITALSRICSLLNQWKTLKDGENGNYITGENFADGDVARLLDCCSKYTK